eukprot:m.28332 g.28332  ORF g.28332 m.28332 type:complete len:297 (+) comp11828_c0_seq1:67-957(+)
MTTLSAIKVHLPNDEIRRFPFRPEHIGLAAFRSAVASLSEDLLGGKTWRLQWTDSDGDRITIASDDELSLAYEYFTTIDNVARFTIILQQEPRNEAAGFERFLNDVVGNARVFVQGQPWGHRGPWGRRGGGHCRRRCGRQQQAPSPDQEQAATGATPAAAEATESAVPAYKEAVHMPTVEPVSLSGQVDDDLAAAVAAQATATFDRPASGSSDDWNLIDEEEVAQQTQPTVPSPAADYKPHHRRARQHQRRSATDEKVAVLQGMGFPQDQATLTALLRRHRGEIGGVVAELFAGRQ